MNTSNHASRASLEQTARMHDLAKLQALRLRSAAVRQFWGAVFARVSGLLARRPGAASASRCHQGV
jgi:hypothetical protein